MVDKDLVDAVKNNPEVAFAAFSNWYVWIPFAWLMFLTYQGILRMTNSTSPKKLGSYAVKGAVEAKRVGIQGVEKVAVKKGLYKIISYLLGIGSIIGLWFLLDKSSNVAFGSVIAFFAIYLLNKRMEFGGTVNDLVEAFLRGMISGGLILLAIWFFSKFTVSEVNMFGDIMFILISIYFGFTILSYLGYTNTVAAKQVRFKL